MEDSKRIILGIELALVGLAIVIVVLLLSILFNMNLIEKIVLSWVSSTLFAILCLVMSNPKPVYLDRVVEKEVQVPVENKVVEFVERPVYVDRVVEKEVPVEKNVIQVVEKPYYIDKPIVKTVYVEAPRKKLHIKKYNFVASKEEKRYHKRTCRLSKIIKKKYKIHNDSESFFKKKRYSPCKLCIK